MPLILEQGIQILLGEGYSGSGGGGEKKIHPQPLYIQGSVTVLSVLVEWMEKRG